MNITCSIYTFSCVYLIDYCINHPLYNCIHCIFMMLEQLKNLEIKILIVKIRNRIFSKLPWSGSAPSMWLQVVCIPWIRIRIFSVPWIRTQIVFPSWIRINFYFHLLPGSGFNSISICYLDPDSFLHPSATWIRIHFYFHLLPGSRFNSISIWYLDPDSIIFPSATWIQIISTSICYLDPDSILFPSATWIQIQFVVTL